MRDRFYIMVPPSRTVKGGPVEVDPSTLSLNMLTELWMRDGTDQNYTRALGIESIVTTGLDPAGLLELWQDMLSQLDQILPTGGRAGEFAAELRGALTDLPEFIRALAGGKMHDATKALEAIGYGMIAAAATATADLVGLEARATQQGNLAETMSGILVNRDDESLYADTALSLADAVQSGLQAHRTLVAYEAELGALYTRTLSLSRAWGSVKSSTPQWLSDHLVWLGDNDTGFCTRASRYLISPDTNVAEAIRDAIREARGRLQSIDDRMKAADDELRTARAAAEAIFEQQFGISQLIRNLKEARKAFARLSQHGVDAFSVVSGFIPATELASWQALAADPEWQSLHMVETRLSDITETIRGLVNTPLQLPDASRRILERAGHYIARLEETSAEFDTEIDDAEAAESGTPGVKPGRLTSSEPADSRLEEIYEQILALGAVKFCGPNHVLGTTPRALLELMGYLGRLTSEEQAAYSGPLRARLERDSYVLTDTENRLAAWHEANPGRYHWIQFRQGRGSSTAKFWMWRLAEQAKNHALGLLIKYDLEPDEIVKAYNTRREDKLRR